jgi:DNA-binding LytR/AlgR family response regulator
MVMDGHSYMLREPIKQWRGRLPEEQFAQLGRSLIVNLRQISGWRPVGRKMEIKFRKSGMTFMLGRSAAIRFQRQYVIPLDAAKIPSS